MVPNFNTKHPTDDRRNAIESMNSAEEAPLCTAISANTGDVTTWVGQDVESRIEGEEDPPTSEEEDSGAILVQLGEANLMAEDSSARISPPLGNLRGDRT
jgi:hypothetical protein